MIFFKARITRYFKYIALIMCLSLSVTFLLLEKAQNEVTDGAIVFVTSVSRKHQHTKVHMTDPLLNPALATFDCVKLFNSDVREMSRAVTFLKTAGNFSHRDESYYENIFLNCENFRTSREYHLRPGSEEEKEFAIAYNILFYYNIEQLERLLRAIYRPQNQYCIHVDRKSPERVLETVELLADCFDNVFVASKLEVIVYASYTRLTADINCMKDHMDRGYDWKYLLNMAASEFPLMTNLQLVQILKEFRGSNDIHEVFTTMDEERFKRKHFTYIDLIAKEGHMIHTKQKKDDPPHGLTITKGNAYNVFSRDFVRFVLEDQRARDLLAWSADTYTPDEHYWATLNNLYSNPFLNTPGGFKGHPDTKPFFGRYIGWKSSPHLQRCKAGYYVHNICIFSVQDLPMLRNRVEIIANKFDIDYDPIVYKCMEEWINNKTVTAVGVSKRRFYRKLSPMSA